MLPTGTKKLRGEVLSTKAKAKAAARSENSREQFYAEIGRLYANGEAIADELLAKVRSRAKATYKFQNAPAGASPKTKATTVASPYGLGVDRVDQVVDSLRRLVRQHVIDEREYSAAVHFREQHDKLGAGIGGSMDFDRARGGSNNLGLAEVVMAAAEVVDRVEKLLPPDYYGIVWRVCVAGHTLDETAAWMYRLSKDHPTTRLQRDTCKQAFKAALSIMAHAWWPEGRGRGDKMTGYRNDRATVTDAPTVAPGTVAHATKDRVYRSGQR
jgi:hypothetical protein